MNILKSIEENNYIKYFNENLSLLIAIPTLIGGLKQFIFLSFLSSNLLTFFSINQLLIDGVIAIIKLSATFFFVYLYKGLILNYCKEKKFYSEKKSWLINYSLKLVMIFWFFVVIFFDVNYYFPQLMDILLFIISSLVIFSLINISIYYNTHIARRTVYLLISLYIVLSDVNGGKSIQNFAEITASVRKKYPEAEIKYFNDQFIFYETKPKYMNSEIVIKKIDDLFEGDKK